MKKRESVHVEFNESKIKEAFLANDNFRTFALRNKELIHSAIDSFMGQKVSKPVTSLNSKGEVVVRGIVERTELEKQAFKPKKEKDLGFYGMVVAYLKEQKAKGITKVSDDELYLYIRKFTPKLKQRLFVIYLTDKRQWKQRGYFCTTSFTKQANDRLEMVRKTIRTVSLYK